MKEESKAKIIHYLKKYYQLERDKYDYMKHKINVWKQYKNEKELQISLGNKINNEHLERMFELSRLIEWVDRL